MRATLTILASKSILSERFNDACKGLNDCQSLKRIQETLTYYQSIVTQNEEQTAGKLLMEYLKTNNYKNMFNDYHHLLLKHLNAEDNLQNAQNYAIIHASTVEAIQCTLSECKCYQSLNNSAVTDKEEKVTANEDTTAHVYRELLNNIHLLIIHGYDTGFRSKYSKEETDDSKADNAYFDQEIYAINASLKAKREALIKVRGQQKFDQNRFLMTAPGKDEKEEKMVSSLDYGHRFYYWDWYKHKNESDPDNIGYKYAQMYLDPKYSDLKEEMTDKLDISQFNYATAKSNKFLKFALKFKKLRSRDTLTCGLHYGIGKRRAMSAQHLLAVICYTDFEGLSYLFRATFKRQWNESIASLKQRNSEFWHLSKSLREAIEVFGDRLGDKPKISVLYHSLSFLYINCAISRVYAPVSMTRQLCVAVICAPQNGIVCEVTHYNYDKPYYFHCALLGFGGAEDERIMFGGKQRSQFNALRMLKTGENYSLLLQSLKILSIITCGESLSVQNKEQFMGTMNECSLLIAHLIEGTETNEYFNGVFAAFTRAQTMLKIDVKKLMRDFGALKKWFVCAENLLLFDAVCKIFVNCEVFDCDMGSGGASVDRSYFEKLTEMLSAIREEQTVQLKTIKILKCKYSEDDFTAFEANNEHWSVEKAGSTKLILRNKM